MSWKTKDPEFGKLTAEVVEQRPCLSLTEQRGRPMKWWLAWQVRNLALNTTLV